MKALDQKFVTTLALAAFLTGLPVYAQTWVPTAVGTYDWNSNGNWSTAFPNATGAAANISGDFTGVQTINLNQAITVGSLTTEDTGAPTDSGVTIAANAGSLTFAVASGSASLVQNSDVVTTISSAVTFNSDTAISGSGAVTLSGATTVATGKTLTISNTGGTTVSGASTFNGNLAVNSALTLSGGSHTLSGLSGSGTITKSNAANGLTVNGDNSAFTGAWVLSGNSTNSRLFISNDNNLGAANVGITLTNTNGITFGAAANVTLASTRTITITGALLGFGTSGSGTHSNTVNSKITGAGGSVRTLGGSTNTVVLGNDTNDFTGSLIMQSGGIFSVNTFADSGVASGAGAGSTVVFGNDSGGGGSLVYTGASAASSNRLLQIVSANVGTGAAVSAQVINNGAGTLTLTNTGNFISGVSASARTLTLGGTNAGLNTFSQLINSDGSVGTGVVSLIKKDAGKWVLGSANTYTGATTINGGTLGLGVNNAIGSGSAIALNAGTFDLQTFSTSAASLGFNAGSSLKFNLGTPGNVTALLALAGGFNKSGSGVFTLDFAGSGQEGTYKLVSFSGTTFASASDFTVVNLGSGLSGVLTLDGSSLNLAVSAVPEPSTYALMAGAFALAGAMVHNRKRRG